MIKKILPQKQEKVSKGTQIIILPMDEEEHNLFISNIDNAKSILSKYLLKHEELFPSGIKSGYIFYGKTSSLNKANTSFRKIKVGDSYYRIYPSYILPYVRKVDLEMEKGLMLARYGVPNWVIAKVVGRNAMYWHRLVIYLGTCSLLGSTIKQKELPEDILSDEKHIYLKGEKAYIATTVAKECILGAEISESADESGLTKAYGVFKDEALNKAPDYSPQTVNTDGWKATSNSLKSLFPQVILILCFLHAFLKVKNVSKKNDNFKEISALIWDIYRAKNKFIFDIRIKKLKIFSETIHEKNLRDKVKDLCDKKEEWFKSLKMKNCHRTSNMLDRVMKHMDRKIFAMQSFHAGKDSANKLIRGFSLIFNYIPCSPVNVKKHNGKLSRAERLNGFSYHDNWLLNLTTATSMKGFKC